jgi:hypothetical protein
MLEGGRVLVLYKRGSKNVPQRGLADHAWRASRVKTKEREANLTRDGNGMRKLNYL